MLGCEEVEAGGWEEECHASPPGGEQNVTQTPLTPPGLGRGPDFALIRRARGDLGRRYSVDWRGECSGDPVQENAIIGAGNK